MLRFPTKKVVCLHGDNSSEDWAIDLLQKPDEWLGREQVDVFIHTGSMGTGVSIDDPNLFDAVFPMFLGIVDPNQARQSMIRYRALIPRFLYCEKHAKPSRGPNSPDPEMVKRQIARNNAEIFRLTDFWEMVEDDPDFLEKHGDILRGIALDEPSIINNPHFDLAAKLRARKNGTIWGHRDKLLQGLEEIEGCPVKIVEDTGRFVHYSQGLKNQKKQILITRANAIANAEVIPLAIAQSLERQASTTEKERNEITKAFLTEELPETPLTGEFVYERVLKDRRKWLTGVKLLHLVEFDDYVHHLDRKHLRAKIMEFSSGDVNMASLKTYSHQVKLIQDCGILTLLGYYYSDNPPELSQNSPEVKAFCDRLYFYRHRFARCFGIRITKKFLSKPMQAVRAIANLVSLDLVCTRRESTGSRLRYYILDRELLADPDRVAVMRSLEIKRKKALEKEAPTPDKPKVSTNPTKPKKDNKEPGMVGRSERFFDTA